MSLARCLVILLFTGLAVPLFSQLDRGTLTGTVTDSTGAVIPGAEITIHNTATGATYRTQSTETGNYNMPNLPPGLYQVIFEAQSFKRYVRSGITLRATEVLRVDGTLELGALTESIQVTAEVPRLQTETPEVGTSLQNTQLVDLPLSFSGTRVAENFAYKVTPGVSGGSWSSHILGSTEFSKETLLDGASVTTERAGHFGESSVSVEALQEFKIQTSGMSAEFARTQGGIFNYIMKSGTNEIHGSAYGALRNEALNANTFVNNFRGEKRSQDRKQNYAFSFGAPVYIPKVYDGHNRTFFYATYERYRQRTYGFGAPSRTHPLPEFYDGDFSRLLQTGTAGVDALGRQVPRGAIFDPATFRQLPNGRWVGEMFPGNRIPASRFSSISRRLNSIAKEHYLPTITDASGKIALTNNAVFPVSSTPEFDQYQFSIKLDQIISDQHKLSGSYSYNARPTLKFDRGGMWDSTDPLGGPLSKTRRQRFQTDYVRLAHDWTASPSVLNHALLFYNRTVNPIGTVYADIDGGQELGIQGLHTAGYPEINWGGGPFVTLDTPGHSLDKFFALVGWGFLDTVSFHKGRHFMKVGFDLRRNHVNHRWAQETILNFNARGTAIPNEAFSGNLSGYAFASYLLGIVDNASRQDIVPLGGRRSYYSAFFQDDLKVSSRLTLNLGVRWEYQPPATEVANRISSWNPAKIDPISGLPGAYDFAGNCSVCTGKNYFGVKKPFRDWGPRFGFAYRMTDRWTMRGSYGIYFDPDISNGVLGSPLEKRTSVAWGGTWPLNADPVQPWQGVFNWDEGFPTQKYVPGSFNLSWGNFNQPGMYDERYGTSPYIQNWNFNLQREVMKNLVVDVGYVGRKGTGLRVGQLNRVNQLPASVLAKYGRNLNNAVRTPAEAAANGIAYPYPGFKGTVASALRQFPQVNGNETIMVYGSPLGFSTFHSLQLIVNREFSRGLTVYGNYTWSKSMANVQSSEPFIGNTDRPLDAYNLKLEKAVSPYDIPHMLKIYANYELPLGRGKGSSRLLNAFIGGWSVSAILNYFSGEPLGFSGSYPLSGGWNGAVNRANVAAGEMLAAGYKKSNFNLANTASPSNTYLNKAVFSDPPPLTLGTSAYRYTQARGFGTINEDLGLLKNMRIREKWRFQLRAEALNLFNRSSLGGIVTNVTNARFGQVTSVSGNRQVQLGLRLDF